LFAQGIPVGVVTGIVGIHRGSVVVLGRADHAGTTPMEVRADALSAGAEAILAFEEVCLDLQGLVGTIGTVQVSPGAPNVVPGEVRLGVEIRSLEETACQEAVSRFEESLKAIEVQRQVRIDLEMRVSSHPVFFNPDMVDLIGRVCSDLGIPHMQLPSGAGHDAGHLAKIAPTGMVFVPSKDGRSHCPEEWTETEHLYLGAEVLCGAVIALDQENTR
jgi:N-carbamoyl-L-amino-acid hydrolase